MNLESSKIILAKSKQALFELLVLPQSYKNLMPENTEFQSDKASFSFQLKGMPEIALKFYKKEHDKIIWQAAGGKIPFELTLHFASKAAQETQIYFDFRGNLNPMLQMMVKKPLKNLLEQMIENTEKL